MNHYVIGIDLGGTKVEACLMDEARHVLSRVRTPAQAPLGLNTVIQNIHKVIADASAEKKYAAVGIGTPGTYVPEQDKLYGSPNSMIYETPGFIGRLKDELGVPLVVENDANCLALAEFFANCEGKYRFVLAVILGTGFGTGLILDNKLYRGARGGAGEIGHTSIDLNGRLCGCGRKGCVEAYLSGPSLSRRFFERCGKILDVPQIYHLYETGNPEAVFLFKETFKIMGDVFANVVNTLDLEAIILGGGVSNLPIWYQKENVAWEMQKSLFGVPRGEIPIIKAKLGDSAGVIGAAYLALRELGGISF
ncbi:MAG: ROK family protein [Candidatus Omnitrophota bacterium]